jgi:hypothetical protein
MTEPKKKKELTPAVNRITGTLLSTARSKCQDEYVMCHKIAESSAKKTASKPAALSGTTPTGEHVGLGKI